METPAYLADAKGRLSEAEREAIVTALARDPYAGVVITGTHGVRKYRHAIGGRGKSGGVRVIYYSLRRGPSVVALDGLRQEREGRFVARAN